MVLTVVRLLTQWGKLIRTTCCMYTVREKTKHSPTRPLHVAAAWASPSKPLIKLKKKKQLVSYRNLKKPGLRWTPVVPTWLNSDLFSPSDCRGFPQDHSLWSCWVRRLSSGTGHGSYVRSNVWNIQPYQLVAFSSKNLFPVGFFSYDAWASLSPALMEKIYLIFHMKLLNPEDFASQ